MEAHRLDQMYPPQAFSSHTSAPAAHFMDSTLPRQLPLPPPSVSHNGSAPAPSSHAGGGGGGGGPPGSDALHSVVKRCLKIFSGRLSATPTASLPTTDDMGLLMFLNLKQAHLSQATSGLDLYRYPVVKPLLSIVEFINFVVEGLIVQAEKIDEMHIVIRKEIVKRNAQVGYQKQDLRVRSKGVGSQLSQILSAHFPDKKPATAPRRSVSRTRGGGGGGGGGSLLLDSLASEEARQAAQDEQQVEEERWMLHQLRSHLRAASSARTLLHGRVPGGVDPHAASGMVAEMNIAQTFRKAMHRIKDSLNEVEDQSSLPALQKLSQFMDYLHYGVAVALDELETCEVLLRKRSVGDDADRKLQILDARDRENKRASCCALRFNSELNTPKRAAGASAGAAAGAVPRAGSLNASAVSGAAPSGVEAYLESAHYSAPGRGGGGPPGAPQGPPRVFASKPDAAALQAADPQAARGSFPMSHASSLSEQLRGLEAAGHVHEDNFLEAYCG